MKGECFPSGCHQNCDATQKPDTLTDLGHICQPYLVVLDNLYPLKWPKMFVLRQLIPTYGLHGLYCLGVG